MARALQTAPQQDQDDDTQVKSAPPDDSFQNDSGQDDNRQRADDQSDDGKESFAQRLLARALEEEADQGRAQG